MEYLEEVSTTKLENLTNYEEYLDAQSVDLDVEMDEDTLQKRLDRLHQIVEKQKIGNVYNKYSVEQKLLFLYFLKFKLVFAKKAEEWANIKERTARYWTRKLETIPEWDIYEKKTNKINRKASQLGDDHKSFLIDFYDRNPTATTKAAIVSLTKSFSEIDLKKTVVVQFISKECNLPVKRPTKHSAARNSETTKGIRYE